MRWVRVKMALLEICLSAYFSLAHSTTNGSVTALFMILMAVCVLGSAFLDRILYDPSAVYIQKPWRIMRPSVGDLFRFYLCLIVAGMILPLMILSGSILSDLALFEVGLFTFGISLYEFLRLYVERVRWHGTKLEVRSKLGRGVAIRWSEIRNIRMARFSNSVIFTDLSGRSVRISKRLRGFSEFMRDAERYVYSDLGFVIQAVK